jgi:hypothetical protein
MYQCTPPILIWLSRQNGCEELFSKHVKCGCRVWTIGLKQRPQKLQEEDVKFLRLHLDRRLTSHKHIFARRKKLGITLTKMCWLLGREPKLSTRNKHILYEAKLKPIWTYGIQLWGAASTSNIEILERFQSKALCMTVDAPWYVPNTVIRRDQIPTVKDCYCSQYSARLSAHPNGLIVNLMEQPNKSHKRPWTHQLQQERHWALFYMSLHTFSHNFLEVLVQTADTMGLQKKLQIYCHHSMERSSHFSNIYIITSRVCRVCIITVLTSH